DVFVSYSHRDYQRVVPDLAWLHAQGITVWFDEGIQAGSDWSETIARAIAGCKVFLIYVSPHSVQSQHCFQELNFALSRRCPLLSVFLEPTRLPPGFELRLGDKQAVFRHEMAPQVYQQRLLDGAREFMGPADAAPVADRPDLASLLAAKSATSVAILPLENASAQADDDILALGITSDVISNLSRFPGFMVISDATTSQYADAPDPRLLGEELGVRYVLRGRLLHAGDRYRVMVELIDTESRRTHWANSFDGTADNIFQLQDNITEGIVGQLEPELLSQERKRVEALPVERLEAWELVHRVRGAYFSERSQKEHLALLDRAIEIAPNYVEAHAQRAMYYGFQTIMGDLSNLPLARQAADEALAMDPDNELTLLAAAGAYGNLSEYERALELCDKALRINPNYAAAWAWTGFFQGCTGRGAEGLLSIERAMRLSPKDGQLYLWHYFKGLCFAELQDFESAARAGEESTRTYSGWFFSWVILAQNHAVSGATEKAIKAWERARELMPMWNLDLYRMALNASPLPEATNQAYLAALEKAGVR
ncbi:MAG: TIR domain-containing protein, partial [Pseudomonadales bacterium]|nr:TIR domain-containing protein [Pseudomonadales bacterium]